MKNRGENKELKAQVAALNSRNSATEKDVQIHALTNKVDMLTANLEAARGELRGIEYGYNAQIAELEAQVELLTAERDEAYAALKDIDSNFGGGVLISNSLAKKTHATINRAART